jgi:tyrosyl-tRNA synthetase
LEEFEFQAGIKILEILKETNLISSNKEGKRKIDEGAVRILNNEGEEVKKIENYFEEISQNSKILKLGKKMIKLVIK